MTYKEVCPKTTLLHKIQESALLGKGTLYFQIVLVLGWEVKHKERSKEEGQQEKRKVGKGVMKESCLELIKEVEKMLMEETFIS